MERIMQEKRIQSIYLRIQRVQKQWSLANLRKITCILFECHRSIAKSIDFYFFLLSWKSLWYQRVQSWKFKTLLWIQNHEPLSRTLNNITFHSGTFPAKIDGKIFQSKEKKYILGSFLPKGNFPKNFSYVQLQGSPSI